MNSIRNVPGANSACQKKVPEVIMNNSNRFRSLGLVSGCLIGALSCGPAVAQLANPWETDGAEVLMELAVGPFVELEILGQPLLYLEIPPPGSTAPSEGVGFNVIGNASATVTAEPDAFIQVAGPENWLGKATMGTEEIGYDIVLRFPLYAASSSPTDIATLPGNKPGPTPGLTVDLTKTGYEREGVIHLEADENWTEHGGIPFPGVYTGSVTITVSADNL